MQLFFSQSSYSMFLVVLFCFSLSLSLVCARPSVISDPLPDSNPSTAQVHDGLALLVSRTVPESEGDIYDAARAPIRANSDADPTSSTNGGKHYIVLPSPAASLPPLLPFFSVTIILAPFVYVFRLIVQTLRKFTITRPGVLELTGAELLPMSVSQRSLPVPDPVSRNASPALGVWVGQSNVGRELPQRPGSAPPLNQIVKQNNVARTTSFERLPLPSTSPSKRKSPFDYTPQTPAFPEGESIPLMDLHPASPLPSGKRRSRSMGGTPRLPLTRLNSPPRRPRSPRSRASLPAASVTPVLIEFSPPPPSDTISPSSTSSPMSSLSSSASSTSNTTTLTTSDLGAPRTPGLGLRTEFDLSKNPKDQGQWDLSTPSGDSDEDEGLSMMDIKRLNDAEKGKVVNKWGKYGYGHFDLNITGMADRLKEDEEMLPLINALGEANMERSSSSSSSDASVESAVQVEVQDIGELPLTPPFDSEFKVGIAEGIDNQVAVIQASGSSAIGVYHMEDSNLIDLESGAIISPRISEDDPFSDLLGINTRQKISPPHDSMTLEPPTPKSDLEFTVDAGFPSSSYLNIPGYESYSPSRSPNMVPSSPFMGNVDIIVPTPLVMTKPLFPDIDQSGWETENQESEEQENQESLPLPSSSSNVDTETGWAHQRSAETDNCSYKSRAPSSRPALALDTNIVEQSKASASDIRQESPSQFVLFDGPLTSSPGEMSPAVSPIHRPSVLPAPPKLPQIKLGSPSESIQIPVPSPTSPGSDGDIPGITVVVEEFLGPAQPPEYNSPVLDRFPPDVPEEVPVQDPDELPLPDHMNLAPSSTNSPISPISPLGILLTSVAVYASGSGLSSPTIASPQHQDKEVPTSQPISPVSQTPTPPASPPFQSFNLPMSKSVQRSPSASSSGSTIVLKRESPRPKLVEVIKEAPSAPAAEVAIAHTTVSDENPSLPIVKSSAVSPLSLDDEDPLTPDLSSGHDTHVVAKHAEHAPTSSDSASLQDLPPRTASTVVATGVELSSGQDSELKLRTRAQTPPSETKEETTAAGAETQDETLAPEPAAEVAAKQPGFRFKLPRSPINLALAVQIRPRLVVDVDMARLVHVFMTIFGWLTLFVMPWKGNNAVKRAGKVTVDVSPTTSSTEKHAEPEHSEQPQAVEL